MPKGTKYVPAKHEEKHSTITHTPNLITKSRSRPVDYTPREVKENKIIDEMRKYKIKANHVNYKILNEPNLIKPEKKPSTKPEPFNITDNKQKKPLLPVNDEVFEFHARPVPKTTSIQPVIKPNLIPRTKPRTSTSVKYLKNSLLLIPVIDEVIFLSGVCTLVHYGVYF